jgi:oligopeptide/dipeptide ABC transporter ATP-binding protein
MQGIGAFLGERFAETQGPLPSLCLMEAPFSMTEHETPILELQDVTKIYKTKSSFFGESGKQITALNRISLKINPGEVFGLVGESGSGKTTVGRLIVKLEEAHSGRVFFNGTDITYLKGRALKAFRLKVQMIFQDPYQSLNPQRSIYDTVAEPLVIHGIGDARSREDLVWDALKAVGLSPPGDYVLRYPHQLSGGQRQRVAIARVMALNPDFVVADEPTSMLDASISAQIFNILLDMQKRLSATLLFITHSLAAARYLCDRIAVIYRGYVMEVGLAEEVIQHPRHPYTQALLDALPRFGHCADVKTYNTLLRAERESSGRVGCPFFARCRIAHRVRCSRETPPLEVIRPSHAVACFYATASDPAASQGDSCYFGT